MIRINKSGTTGYQRECVHSSPDGTQVSGSYRGHKYTPSLSVSLGITRIQVAPHPGRPLSVCNKIHVVFCCQFLQSRLKTRTRRKKGKRKKEEEEEEEEEKMEKERRRKGGSRRKGKRKKKKDPLKE
ncbi:hypothetical protein E2C01_092037 [Portunus trituberculatus]|uniref:Uncharacterized protein n=1 Tax=Portunus trituberculatus TaxID=210409 RepID=A0A5B7JFI4_PORTR|nr:hypothetical protein [Portunus trituberculatus]